MAKLTGYKLLCPTGFFYDPRLKIKIYPGQVFPASGIEGKKIEGTQFEGNLKQGGIIRVYESEQSGGDSAPSTTSSFNREELAAMTKGALLKLASKYYDRGSLTSHGKEDLIELLLSK